MDSVVLKELKTETRHAVTERRKNLSAEDRALKSRMACANLLSMVAFTDQDIVGLFLPIRSEIDACQLEPALRKLDATLALPVPIGRTGMIFREWLDDREMVDLQFGTRGPDDSAHELIPTHLVMPLLAFDSDCNRLGYGAGHYDRYISERIIEGNRPMLIGLAFSVQQLDKVPVGRYDLPLDMIVTEDGVITSEG